ncbi:MAG: fumarate hydratase [Clostridiales bacterium]|nr:fumarate hydratase [Clostridiales bacterium]
MIREISGKAIAETVEKLILRSEYELDPALVNAVEASYDSEDCPAGKYALGQLLENYRIAKAEHVAICQDTGMCVVFCELGQDAHISGGSFEDAINEGVRRAYRGLRKSVVKDPLYDRSNTLDNTPAVIYTRLVPGDRLSLTVICKGFGSENMSAIKMLPPSAGEQGVVDFAVNTVRRAGANPCPPMILGVAIGGTFEQAALYAKLMTARPFDEENPSPAYAALEKTLLEKLNALNIGAAGFGGKATCLKVNICALPTHIAGMPVAINVCCHASRHAKAVI